MFILLTTNHFSIWNCTICFHNCICWQWSNPVLITNHEIFPPSLEYGYTMNITEKSDVYSYGVVLLEILTGRSAVETRLGDGQHIVEWVKKKMGSFEPAITILDAKLQGLPDQMVQEILQTLGITMFCVNSSPAERPTMKEVVALLMEVKSSPEEWGKTSQPLIKQSSNQS